jgi:hypothetical protein
VYGCEAQGAARPGQSGAEGLGQGVEVRGADDSDWDGDSEDGIHVSKSLRMDAF